ncbi:hypothetical protein F5Y07DRAFT_408862 [Xylaria sp. FL0933]|nr:hypothetical protein F5Y07DRAFT_408862 [Xylaria sp. FL0933]
MADPQEDTSYQAEATGEMPCSGHDSLAGFPTSTAAQPVADTDTDTDTDMELQSSCVSQSSRCPVDGVSADTTSHPSKQDIDPSQLEDDGISLPSPSTESPLLSSSSSSSSSSTPAISLTFLNLPLEIRLEIYSHLLTTQQIPSYSSPLAPSPSSSSSSSSSSSPPSCSSSSPAPFFTQQTAPSRLYPNILRTCRQLHAECTPILYRSNTFLTHTSLLTVFPSLYAPHHPRKSHLPPVRSAALTSLITRFRVRVRLDAEPQFAREAATAQLSGKSEVVVEAWQTQWRAAGPEALRVFEDVRGVRAAAITGSTGGFEDYARWLERAMMAGAGEYVAPFPWEEDGL